MIRTLALLFSILLIAVAPAAPIPRLMKRTRKRCDRTRVSTLNCRTLLADVTLDDLDATLIASDIAVCALQEVRRDGSLSTTTSHYKIYWYGEHSGRGGVGFAVHKKYVHLVKDVRPVPNSDGRLLLLDILLHDTKYPTTLLCAYSPPNTSPLQTRNKFYSKLREITTPSTWLLGDFNARVGRCLSIRDIEFGAELSDTVGLYSLKGDIVPNANGSSLLDIASQNGLRHVSSHFKCRDSKRWTWKHPRYGTRAVLDHILIPASKWRMMEKSFVVQHITVFTDHRLVVCEMSFHPRNAKKPSAQPPSIDKSSLRCSETADKFASEISAGLGTLNPEHLSTEELSSKIRTIPVSAAENVLPLKAKTKYPSEFSTETINLIQRKRKAWIYLQKSGKRVTRSMRDAFRSLCKDVKQAISTDRVTTLEKEAIDLSNTFKTDRFKGYKLLKQQHRTRINAIMPPEADFTNHYRTHYQLGPETPAEIASCSLPASESDDILTREEFDSGLRKLNENRQPGHDNCAPEYIKRGGAILHEWIFVLMLRIWTFACNLPAIDRIGLLIPIPKKTSVTSPGTARPICLLTSLYKLYAILVFRKVCDRVKNFVSWTQAGFIRGRSCANNLWVLRRVAERAIEFNVPVYCALIDYKGAFDSINRTTLGRVLGLFLSPAMVRRVLCLYFDAKAMVSVNNCLGPEFELLRGVRQGCPASPSFFTVALSFISWSFRITFEGLKLVTLHLSTLEYADDQILFTVTPGALQDMLDYIVATGLPFGLRLSPDKCELICFHRPGSVDFNTLPAVIVGDKILPWKRSVIYLGSCIADDGNALKALKHRICCAETVVKRLNKRVFSRRAIDVKLKGSFIESAVFASLLYGLELCSFGIRERRCLDGYFLKLAKRVMGLPFDFHLSYVEAERRLGVRRPSIRLAMERLRWTGHMLRSEEIVLYEAATFIPPGGRRGRGRPRRRYVDTIKLDLANRNIHLNTTADQFWENLRLIAANRTEWNSIVKREEARIDS